MSTITLLPCDPHYTALGFLGVTTAVVLCNTGAAYGTAKAGNSVGTIGVMKPEAVMRAIIPIIMAGILGIYGLIIGIIICQGMASPGSYAAYTGFAHLGGGLCIGFSCVAAGYAIGVVGEVGIRGLALQPKLFVGMLLILIFCEALALYGLIVALIVSIGGHPDLCAPWDE